MGGRKAESFFKIRNFRKIYQETGFFSGADLFLPHVLRLKGQNRRKTDLIPRFKGAAAWILRFSAGEGENEGQRKKEPERILGNLLDHV